MLSPFTGAAGFCMASEFAVCPQSLGQGQSPPLGLARFSSMALVEIFSHGLGGPLFAELLLLPAVGVWAWRSGSSARAMIHG